MTLVWGISALSHDASLAVLDGTNILFAAHAERYSRVKNDLYLHPALIEEALSFGRPDLIAWYERPLIKKARQVRAGQWFDALQLNDLPRRYLRSLGLPFRLPPIEYVNHHRSHAIGGVATSGFDETAVIVADAIGEFTTFSIGSYTRGSGYRTLHERRYPHSLGLLYSAFTRRCGFRPNEDEYIVMGMAAFGTPRHVDRIYEDLIEVVPPSFRVRINPHRGIGEWAADAEPADLAASIQQVTEDILVKAAEWVARETGSRNLVLMGGVALNCVANTRIAERGLFDRIWILPNPGDAGSSIGAAAAVVEGEIDWRGPYLGTSLGTEWPVDDILAALIGDGVVGVASGKAEFGPRALGNRSLLADPRPADMKDRVNKIKGREPFRPFAPVVRKERAHELFDLPVHESPYMQFTARSRLSDEMPAVVHFDGTSRVQTVAADQHPGLYALLTAWEQETGCAALLNTSLNGRSEPLLNDSSHVESWVAKTGIRVIS